MLLPIVSHCCLLSVAQLLLNVHAHSMMMKLGDDVSLHLISADCMLLVAVMAPPAYGLWSAMIPTPISGQPVPPWPGGEEG